MEDIFKRGTLQEVEERLERAIQDGIITIKPQTATCGAEITNLNIKNPLTPLQKQAVRDAILKYKVLVFKKANLTHREHVEFGRNLGQLTIGHIYLGFLPEHPEIYQLKRIGKEYDEDEIRKARQRRQNSKGMPVKSPTYAGWHSDITAAINPPAISMLRAVQTPEYGGDTTFVNTAVAYTQLSAPLKQFVETLWCVHYPSNTWPGPFAERRPTQARKNEVEVDFVTEHPLITIHPETNEKVINISPAFVNHIKGLSPRESEQILFMLQEHATRVDFQFRHSWDEGDIVLWDNRATMHLAPTDTKFWKRPFVRDMYRITTIGQPLIAANGIDRSKQVSGSYILPVKDELANGLWKSHPNNPLVMTQARI